MQSGACAGESIATPARSRPSWARPSVLSGAALEEQSRAGTAQDRGQHRPCATASCTYTAAARAANKAAESLRTAALRSCHRSTGSGCGENNKTATTTTKRQTIIVIKNDRVMRFDGSACGGWAAGDPAAWQKPQRGQVHSGTFSLNTYTSSSARVGLHPPPRTRSPSESPAPRCNHRLHLLRLPWGRRPVRCLRFINKFRGGRRGMGGEKLVSCKEKSGWRLWC